MTDQLTQTESKDLSGQTLLLKQFHAQIDAINGECVTRGIHICFLDLFPSHYQFSKDMIWHLSQTHPVALLVMDVTHPAYRERDQLDNVRVFLIEPKWINFVLQWLIVPTLVTPASHAHPSVVRPDMNVVHTFHSLVSMHAVYGDDAFDAYTHIFACGPHHVTETIAIKAARGLPPAKIYEVGYPKLDDLGRAYSTKAVATVARQKILLAPSWHPTNLLKTHGEAICRHVLDLGYEVIIRPHPHLYDGDAATMGTLRRVAAGSHGRVEIENPNEKFASFWKADLMISDWSGVAFEYAFATERPVVFIDAPRKVNSVELLAIDVPTIEESLRTEVGTVVESVDRLSDGIRDVASRSSKDWAAQIRAVREKYLFNYKSSAEAGAKILAGIADETEMLPSCETSDDRLMEFINYYS